MVVGNEVWLWRWHHALAEIREPGGGGKRIIVPAWQLQGHETMEAWEKDHENCCDCCEPCSCYVITPAMVRAHIDGLREAR